MASRIYKETSRSPSSGQSARMFKPQIWNSMSIVPGCQSQFSQQFAARMLSLTEIGVLVALVLLVLEEIRALFRQQHRQSNPCNQQLRMQYAGLTRIVASYKRGAGHSTCA
mmetsp:Transcript_49279/g.102801  ORF Transcript_49279/g.102801 Transcript_49279/m.102801 type:complete len:111 (-) Transcript_49279:133-465(-)